MVKSRSLCVSVERERERERERESEKERGECQREERVHFSTHPQPHKLGKGLP